MIKYEFGNNNEISSNLPQLIEIFHYYVSTFKLIYGEPDQDSMFTFVAGKYQTS